MTAFQRKLFQKAVQVFTRRARNLQIGKSLRYIGNFKLFFQNRFIMDNDRVKIYLMFA
ncbi:hypothetical protein SB48_HM08orf06617 [Heyndrickxia coagulans]|uniref:Uncharacterized protein n=1 Tax=Heyndrickxia coagulans TaxID=1398 RepID=A0AAN0T8Q1_HEYCO|nr:hypothetical protein SB48_HM08orf06617 [Heyndrickxia coagulans]